MVIEGQGAIEGVRAMMGSTDPKRSAPGTIRGDMGIDLSRNIVHGSDSLESAKREISLFFEEGEIFEYTKAEDAWTYPHERKSGV
jgi:nucleoside-diphosphate kinase